MTVKKSRDALIKVSWLPEEDAILRELYPRATCPELLGALPGRTMATVRYRANRLGIRCEARQHLGKVASPASVQDGIRGKHCVVCLEWKPLRNFARHSTCAEGRRNKCTTCEGRWAHKHHREARIAAVRRYQARYPEKFEAAKRNNDARRRAAGLRHHGRFGVTTADLRRIRETFGTACVYCGAVATTLDHVVPLSRGGLHSVENLVPACGPCNRSKHAKTPEEWQATRG